MKRLHFALFMSAASAIVAATPASTQVAISINVNFAPPALPVYDQPPIPAPDYIWMPGYWAWDDYVQDYFWVPGTWMSAPRPGLLWTPPWWGWQGGSYLFHPGYWAPHVGFYGGVVYGFGYTGVGFEGAVWSGQHVSYNRAVTNIKNVNVTNVYNQTVAINRTTKVSYNGGPGGVQAQPSYSDLAVMREPHVAPSLIQQQHVQAARANRQLFSSANQGRPPIAAAQRPTQLSGPGIVPTRQAAPYQAPSAHSSQIVSQPKSGRKPALRIDASAEPYAQASRDVPFERTDKLLEAPKNIGNSAIDRVWNEPNNHPREPVEAFGRPQDESNRQLPDPQSLQSKAITNVPRQTAKGPPSALHRPGPGADPRPRPAAPPRQKSAVHSAPKDSQRPK